MNGSNEFEQRVISGRAWEDFCDALKTAGNEILRPETPNSALDRAEGWRYLSRVTRWALENTIERLDPDFPTLYQWDGTTIKIGADNPDSVYSLAIIRGDRSYLIRGIKGNAPYLTFGSKANRYHVDGTMASTGELDARRMHFEPDGSFEIILSQDKPTGGKNWLPIVPDTSNIVVRENFFQYHGRIPSTMKIERIGGPSHPKPVSAEFVDRNLQSAAALVRGTAHTFIDWIERFRKSPNQLPPQDQTLYWRGGGDPNIHYMHGFWELEPDEALIIDTRVPECEYWNFELENYWMESLEFRWFPVWTNHEMAKYNPDGSVTLVVAAEDPGFGNWLNTTGHRSGACLLRWVRAKEFPTPTCRVVKIADVRR